MSTKDDTIPLEMTGVTCYAPKDYRFEKKAVPVCGPDDVLIRVGACGICAGDAKCFSGNMMFWGDEHRAPYVQTPVTPGHEFVGTVVAVGENVQKGTSQTAVAGSDLSPLEVGDHVTAEQIVSCGACLYCRRGLRWLCAPHDIFGFHTCTHGGMAQYMLFPRRSIIYKLPKGLPSHHAAFVEPLSCAVHGVERGDIQFADTVVVSGCGPIGLGMIAAAKRKSPQRLVALDLNPQRLELARDCGADIVINPQADDAVKRVREMTGGYGCDVYLEATGHPSSVEQGLLMCRKAATFVEFSVFGQKTTVDWTIIGDSKELDIRGGHLSGDGGYQTAVEMLRAGGLPVERIVTHALPLQEFRRGIDLVDSGRESIKVVLTP
eukprot:TRINITY_DN37358_c0_g1_i1.p1 TRINITY_DN37358_c0_g1~~TRINITY_DN37358_c0_g1_i1.p1  ORF type:complete len:377 (-),score=84.15 TRINITY_DN37358_c0_g1_i1:154-1284(-)